MCIFVFTSTFSYAELAPLKTHEPVYQNPFDLASGGAVLTRATQEGVIFSNPSLAAFGAGFLRTITGRATLHLGTELGDLAREVVRDRSVPSDLLSIPGILDRAQRTPIHAGQDISAAGLTSLFGIAAFATTRVDIETSLTEPFPGIQEPVLHMRNHGYSGMIASSAAQIADVFAVGAAAKAVYAAELQHDFSAREFTDTAALKATALGLMRRGGGTGFDGSATFQLRSRFLDFRLAAVMNDIGGTSLGTLPAWKQTLNLGIGAAVHGRDHALHCGYDIRDVQGAYSEAAALRTYMGCKAIFTRWFAFGAGLSQGKLTYGAVFNLLLLRIETGRYTKRFSSVSGAHSRSAYFLSIGGEIP